MDDLLNLIEGQHNLARQEQRHQQDEVAHRECVVAACHAVAAWSPGSVVEPGWRPAEQSDTVVQLAWALCDLAGAVSRGGLIEQLGKVVVEEVDPARAYALGLVMLAGQDEKREELEQRLGAVWVRPPIWREVAAWIRRIPELLWPQKTGAPSRSGKPCRSRTRGTRRIDSAVEDEPQHDPVGSRTAPFPEPQDSGQNQLAVVSLKQAARMLGVSLRKAYKMFRAGELQGPAGKPYRAYLRSINELLATPRTASNSPPAESDPLPQPDPRQQDTTPEQRRPPRQGRSPQGFQFFELP